jgi:glycosyltransferase involved in cell wall biosynthesis
MGVSIIVPAYNAEKFLAATIQSVLAQSVADWELVVVNDGSTDQTGTIAEKFSRLDKRIRVVHQANAGVSAARNRGFAETREDYDYIMFLDSDDLLDADALEILLRALEQDQEAVAAHGMLRCMNSEGQPETFCGSGHRADLRQGIQGIWLKTWPVTAATTFENLAFTNNIAVGTLMIRRASKVIAGDFDTSLKICEDHHLWLRLSRLGHIAFVNRVFLSYRRHESNALTPEVLGSFRRFELNLRKKIYELPDLNDRERRVIILGYRHRELFYAKLHLSTACRQLYRRKLREAFNAFRAAIKEILRSMKSAESIFG